jgi:hypothetical protein
LKRPSDLVVYFDRIEGRPDSAPSSSLVTQSDAPKTVNAARRHGFDAVLRRLCLESTSISAQKLDSPSYATAVFIGGNARFSLLTTRVPGREAGAIQERHPDFLCQGRRKYPSAVSQCTQEGPAQTRQLQVDSDGGRFFVLRRG